MEIIDKAVFVAEIENKIKKYTKRGEDSDALRDGYAMYWGGVLSCLNEIRSLLDTLEVKEVDLEEELKNCLEKEGTFINDNREVRYYNGDSFNHIYEIEFIAKHFYEFGLSVRSLSTKSLIDERIKDCPYKIVGGCGRYQGIVADCNGACAFVVDYLKLKELKAKKGE